MSVDRGIHLKVKLKTLATEAQLIRWEQNRLKAHARKLRDQQRVVEGASASASNNAKKAYKNWLEICGGAILSPDNKPRLEWAEVHMENFFSLYHHRIHVVRPELRATHLARGLLAGQLYSDLENIMTRRTKPNWARVAELVASFGKVAKKEANDRVASWSGNEYTY